MIRALRRSQRDLQHAGHCLLEALHGRRWARKVGPRGEAGAIMLARALSRLERL